MPDSICHRVARPEDLPDLRAMQVFAARQLGAEDYDSRRIESFLTHVGTMEDGRVHDGTYYLAESDGLIVGCGGWSTHMPGYAKVRSAAGPGQITGCVPKLRSMYVHPAWARRGIASAVMEIAESAAQLAGFRRIELTATLTGRKVYCRRGYAGDAPTTLSMPDGAPFPVVHMEKQSAVESANENERGFSSFGLRELCADAYP